ncbi:TolB family protein [Deinococcus radiopugnans]|uniref:TolB family protein n=1 Tax=Deinococcus radiopugnans TaxID=57497 RepID=UPI0036099729
MSNSLPGPDSLLALAFPSDPQVSPDGGKVAFVLARVEEEDPQKTDAEFARPRYKTHLWLSDGGPARQLTHSEGRDSSPRWSPDGETLAFVRTVNGRGGQLYLLPLGGGEARRVTGFKGAVQDVQFSPDGRFLAFFSGADDEDKRDERGEARVITRPRYRFNGRDWLPERPARLWRYDIGADTVTEWHTPDTEINSYTWQPDSDGVLFVSSADELAATQGQQEVWQLPLEGQPTQLTHWNSGIGALIPHPDGGASCWWAAPKARAARRTATCFCSRQTVRGGDWTRATITASATWWAGTAMSGRCPKSRCG